MPEYRIQIDDPLSGDQKSGRRRIRIFDENGLVLRGILDPATIQLIPASIHSYGPLDGHNEDPISEDEWEACHAAKDWAEALLSELTRMAIPTSTPLVNTCSKTMMPFERSCELDNGTCVRCGVSERRMDDE